MTLSSMQRLGITVTADNVLKDPKNKWGDKADPTGSPQKWFRMDEEGPEQKAPTPKDKSGKDAPLDPQSMIKELDEGLTGIVGPFKKQPFVPAPNGKFKTVVHAGKPGRGKQVYRFLEGLGFTGVSKAVTGYYGGVRHETNGKITVVDYHNFSGVTSITTQLK